MVCQTQKQGQRTVLVTGGAVRLGAAIVETLARNGWNVVMHAHRSITEGEQRCAQLRASGFQVGCVSGDLSQPDAAQTIFARALETSGTLDAVVNNASIFSPRPLDALSSDVVERMEQINFRSPQVLMALLLTHLAQRQVAGSVVNLLDQRIVRVTPPLTPYLQTKLELSRETLQMARRGVPWLRVNAVAPGAVLVPMDVEAREAAGPFPLGRRPTVGDVARAVRFLLEEEALTGQILYVDGGQHLSTDR